MGMTLTLSSNLRGVSMVGKEPRPLSSTLRFLSGSLDTQVILHCTVDLLGWVPGLFRLCCLVLAVVSLLVLTCHMVLKWIQVVVVSLSLTEAFSLHSGGL